MLHRHKSLFVTCVFLFALVEYAEAQRTVPIHFEIGLNEHVGKLIKIHGEYPPSKLATLTEVSLLWQRFQPYDWQQGYGFPAYGFSLVHAQFGNQDVLGQSIAAIPMMRFDRWKGFTRYSLKAGFGLAWFNKPYDAQNNPENLVIGSRFTNMSMLRTDVTTQFSDRCTASIGLSFTHCSNSHFAVPNIGANIVAVHAGLAFHNRRGVLQLDESVYSNPSSFPKRRYMWWYSLHSILGFHEAIGTIRPVDGPRYPVYGIGLFGNKKIAHRIYAVGVNYHYYPYMHDYIISQELFDASLAKRNAQTVVVFAGFEWEFGRFSFFVQAGVNVFSPFIKELNEVWDLPKQGTLNLWTSNKLGYRYYFYCPPIGRLFIQAAVKANGGTADFLELGVGMRFFRYQGMTNKRANEENNEDE